MRADTTSYYQNNLNSFISKVFGLMFLGLIATFLTAFAITYSFKYSPAVSLFFINNSWILFAIPIVEVILVFFISFAINSFSYSTLKFLFILYSVLNGVTFSVVLLSFTGITVMQAFLAAGVTFGVMAVFGATTNKDLTGFGTYLIMALMGVLILSVINIFFTKSSGLDWALCIAGLFLFIGLTAYDMQTLKNMYLNYCNGEMEESEGFKKVILMGALTLYLDFINIFLKFLQVFSRMDD